MKMGLPEVLSKEDWLSKTLAEGSRVGLDPKLISVCMYLFVSELYLLN